MYGYISITRNLKGFRMDLKILVENYYMMINSYKNRENIVHLLSYSFVNVGIMRERGRERESGGEGEERKREHL